MKKVIDISHTLKDLTGEPLKEGKADVTLRKVLWADCPRAGEMNFSQAANSVIYGVGVLFGTAKDPVSLGPDKFDPLKKVVDGNRVVMQGRDQS